MSGIAKTRHQLATLLRDAYQNRDALEERIAEGRRNRKEAGNKYGKALVSTKSRRMTMISRLLTFSIYLLDDRQCRSFGLLYDADHTNNPVLVHAP